MKAAPGLPTNEQSVTITEDTTAGAEKITYEFTNFGAGLFSLVGASNPTHVNGLLVLQEEENLCEKNTQMLNKCLLLSGTETGLCSGTILEKVPSLGGNAVQVWGNYALVSNEERKRMACAPRDMLIEQVQTAPSASFGGQTPFPTSQSANMIQQYDVRFSHAIKVVFFGARNTTFRTVHSNYSTGVPCLSKKDCGGCLNLQGIPELPSVDNNTPPSCDIVKVNANVVECCNAQDPLQHANIIYENTQRLGLMASDYYSQVQPYYHATSIPEDSSPVFSKQGYHMYSYSLDFTSLDPLGSTNYGKLTNVSLSAMPSQNWGRAACVSNDDLCILYDTSGNINSGTKVVGGLGLIDSANSTQKFSFEFVASAINNNVVRISGGALGFPVL